MPISYIPLSEISPAEIIATFNESFKGYPVPVSMTPELFDFKCHYEDIDLRLSAGALDDGKLVGVILYAWRELKGKGVSYNAGTGVVASQRGRHLVAGMYEFAIPMLKAKGVEVETLEVLTQNTVALRAYKNRGYQIQRTLDCFRGSPVEAQLPEGYAIQAIEASGLFRFEDRWECQPAWQYMRESILNLAEQSQFTGAYFGEKLVGTMAFDTVRSYLLHLYVEPEHRRKGLGGALLRQIHQATGKPVSAVNIDKEAGAGLCTLFESVGMSSFIQQYEMSKDSA